MRQALDPPPYPEELAYLHEAAIALVGRSGVGMSGFAPVAYSEIVAYQQLTGRRFDEIERNALLTLDAVIRQPEAAKKPEPATGNRPKAWPSRGQRKPRKGR